MTGTAHHFEFGWRTADSLQIYAQGWQPDTAPQAIVCFIHGIGEHSSRYGHVAAAFCRAGYPFLTFDHRGHGKSQGKRGHTPSYTALLDDITRLLAEAAQRYPHLPRFLYGHSMGGNLVLNYVLRRHPELAGVIATSPWLKLATKPPTLQVKLAQWGSHVWPSLTLSSGLDINAVSRDPATVRAYQTDPLTHNKVSLRLFADAYQAGQWAIENASDFPLPLLLTHGSADRITSAPASRQFARAAPGNCTFHVWHGLYHEAHNEPEKQEVLDFMVNWVKNCTPSENSSANRLAPGSKTKF